MSSHRSPVIRFVTSFTDRKASIQEQTIHPVTYGSKVMPWQWEQWLSNLWRKLHQPVQVCNEAFEEEELTMLFALIGSFVFFWMEVNNVMSFTRTCLWEILFFCLGLLPVLYSEANIKPLFTFCPGEGCQVCTELFLEDPPLFPPQQVPSDWLQEDDRLWHLASVISGEPFSGPEHMKPRSSKRSVALGDAWQCFPLPFTFGKFQISRPYACLKTISWLLFSYSMNLYSNMRTRGKFSLDTNEKRWEGMNRLENVPMLLVFLRECEDRFRLTGFPRCIE